MIPTNAFELRTQLSTAAKAAYADGATDKQVNMIVALTRSTGNFNTISDGRLTKREASRIIDFLMSEGATPVWAESADEIAAREAANQKAGDDAAYRARRKARAKAAKKAEREASKPIAETATFTESDRVEHRAFGTGTVAAINGTKLTVKFDSGKTKIMASSFLKSAE